MRRSCRLSTSRTRVEPSPGTSGSGSGRRGGISSNQALKGDARPNTLIHLCVSDIDSVSDEFGIPVDEEALAGRECDLEDPDGNRLRVATRRS